MGEKPHGAVKWLAAAASVWRPYSDQIMIPQQHLLGTVQHSKHKFHICVPAVQKRKEKGFHQTAYLGPTLSVAHRCSIFFTVKKGRRGGRGGFSKNVNYFPSDFIQHCARKLCSTWETFKDLCHKQGWRNPRHQASVDVKFCPVVPNYCSFSFHFHIWASVHIYRAESAK
jgi:hypothetical protein